MNPRKDMFVIGFAMFAIFFGAGNLIFPPMIGLASGSHVVLGIIGMTLTGILLPMLAMAAVGNLGTGLEDVTKHVNSKWHIFYMVLTLMGVMFGTIPRCGAVSYEIGLRGIFPALPDWTRIAFLIAFFGISYLFARNKSSVIDKIGELITPILLIALLIIVVLTVVNPLGRPSGGFADNALTYSMLQSYNTGDVVTGLICADIFIKSIREKGYNTPGSQKKMLSMTILVAFVILFTVYGGLCLLGSMGTPWFHEGIDNTALLIGLINRLAGYAGIVVLSVAILFACLTTAAGMIATSAGWIEDGTNGKIRYQWAAVAVTLVIFLVSSTGVSSVLRISSPIFIFIYPMSITMVILGLLHRFVPNDGAWRGAVYTATAISVYDAFVSARINELISLSTPRLDSLMASIPLASYGFDWLIPTVVGFFAGAAIYAARRGKHETAAVSEAEALEAIEAAGAEIDE